MPEEMDTRSEKPEPEPKPATKPETFSKPPQKPRPKPDLPNPMVSETRNRDPADLESKSDRD